MKIKIVHTPKDVGSEWGKKFQGSSDQRIDGS